MKGICGGNGCSGCDRDRPPEANQSLHLLHKWYLQAADEAPAVRGPVLAMMWGGCKVRNRSIVTMLTTVVYRINGAHIKLALGPKLDSFTHSAAQSKLI
eukprot:scaffold6048_cov90-Cyclotella_meneghiniana.AAC.7